MGHRPHAGTTQQNREAHVEFLGPDGLGKRTQLLTALNLEVCNQSTCCATLNKKWQGRCDPAPQPLQWVSPHAPTQTARCGFELYCKFSCCDLLPPEPQYPMPL
jgi:hypothetical protein